MQTEDHTARQHCELSPSSSYRWLACPGSVSLSRGLPNKSSRFADEGTAAHELAEKCLRSGGEPIAFFGQEITVHGEAFKVTEEMAANVKVYTDHVRALVKEYKEKPLLEHRFNLDKLNPPATMLGTADAVLFAKFARVLHVVDLKYGAGVLVDVVGNPQLQYYALGAITSLGLEKQVDKVVLTIVQPRIDHPEGPVRSVEMTPADLRMFALELLEGADAALQPDAPLNTGKHCQFCPAAAQCPQNAADAHAVLLSDFAAIEPGVIAVTVKDPNIFPEFGVIETQMTKAELLSRYPEAVTVRDGRLLTFGQVVEMLPKLDHAEAYIKAIRAFAYEQAMAGIEIPGFKLVPKKANRAWKDEDTALKFARKYKLGKKDIYVDKIVSPAGMEKLLPKGVEIPEMLFSKESSGLSLVPESDKREAVKKLTAIEEFANVALPGPVSEVEEL